jgi:hypothetical protein
LKTQKLAKILSFDQDQTDKDAMPSITPLALRH